jgi:CHAD domain-containing protein
VANEYVEREVKFDVSESFELPDLNSAAEAVEVASDVINLRATYYDTTDRHLQRHGVTLRRRTGGDDAGWHLKVPHSDARLELQSTSRGSSPPRELSETVLGLRFGQPLKMSVKLETTRHRHQLRSPSGGLIAEVVDDYVDARRLDAGDEEVASAWREVEVELGDGGDDATVERIADVLTAAGAQRAEHWSKYAKAAGDPPATQALTGLAGLVNDYLQTQYERIALGDLRLRQGDNAIHKTRVAVRRTRSTLRIFKDVFDDDRRRMLDAELSWYAEVLGTVRDLDSIRRRLSKVDLDISSDGLEAFDRALVKRREAGWQEVGRVLAGRRYQSLLRELELWRTDPPWTEAGQARRAEVSAYVGRAEKKSLKRLRQAKDSGSDDDMHRARKATKRTRYAAELAAPKLGKPAKRLAKSNERMQDELGAVQDAVMTSALLADIAVEPRSNGRRGFACGVLYAAELDARQTARSRVLDG